MFASGRSKNAPTFLFDFVFYGQSRTPVPTIWELRHLCHRHLRRARVILSGARAKSNFFRRDPERCFASFDPRFTRISTLLRMTRRKKHRAKRRWNLGQTYAAFGIGICAAFSIFSIKIPYPVVGSLISTWVTAPTSFPF